MRTIAVFIMGLMAFLVEENAAVPQLTFLESISGCTNANDGLLSSSMYLINGNCMPVGSQSIDNGCGSGTIHLFNTTTCSGSPLKTFQRDACADGGLYRCSSYSDPEYLRISTFQSDTCNTPVFMKTVSRVDICYPGFESGSLSIKLEKINASALRTLFYDDTECKSVNHTTETLAGTCSQGVLNEFVSADQLVVGGSSASRMDRSILIMAFAGLVTAHLTL